MAMRLSFWKTAQCVSCARNQVCEYMSDASKYEEHMKIQRHANLAVLREHLAQLLVRDGLGQRGDVQHLARRAQILEVVHSGGRVSEAMHGLETGEC